MDKQENKLASPLSLKTGMVV